MLHLQKRGPVRRPDERWILEAREAFDRQHWIRLRGFLHGPLLDDVQRGVRRAAFRETRHEHVSPPSVDLAMLPNATAAMLDLLCNDAVLRDVLADATGCGPFTTFEGFVYRLVPGSGFHHNWHSDCVRDRRAALSINLDPQPYEGGELLIRDRASERVLGRVENVSPGDALLFRIDAGLQHRVQPVTRGTKTAFAGWFSGSGSLPERLREAAARG